MLQCAGRFGSGLNEFATVTVGKPMSRFSLLRPAALARAIAEIKPDARR
jgi:hypothetical protein